MHSSPRNIVHLITSLGGGGTENFLVQILTDAPAGLSHEVYYLGKDGVNGERIRHLGIPVQRVSSWPAFYRRLCTHRPAMLHTCLYWAHQTGRVVGRLANVPLIVSSHQSIDVWQKPWHRWIDRWTLPLSHVVDVNSTAAQRVLEERLQNASRKPRFVRVDNGVDFVIFKSQPQAEARRSLDVPANAVIGGTLMRLHPEKGAEKIPAFVRQTLQADPKLIFLIGGTGPLEATLKSQTHEFGNRIRWLGWQEDVVRFLSALDFFWLLSREESFPQALLEASAIGLPWVAPDVGGIGELASAGACGTLSPSVHADALSDACRKLLAELPEKTRQARAGVDALRARYSLAAMRQAFYRILDENDL